MPRSNPPESSTAEDPRRDSDRASRTPTGGRPLRRKLAIRTAALIRWLHIYLSMFGLAAVLFFSVTGITLNHPAWFYGEAERSVQAEGQMDLKWFSRAAPSPGRAVEVDKLEVVEHLRKTHGVRGALTEFRVDEDECIVTFKGPGYSADAFIDRGSGRYRLTQSSHGIVAVMNDLHKGRDTGMAWSIVIDLSAVLMTVISITGLALVFYLKLRRRPGLVVTAVGAIAVVLVFLLWVP
jgi:uncharacterized protein